VAVTSDMQLLYSRLAGDANVQAQYRADPSAAVAGYDLTAHEHDAIVTKDLDDLVALGLAPTIEALPEVVRGTRSPQPPGPRRPDLGRPGLERPPGGPEIPRPRPRPMPGPPDPRPDGPRPRPRPGPDPPKPDIRGGRG